MNLKTLLRRRVTKRRKADARALFAAVGITASLLLLAFVLQHTLPGNQGIVARLPAPDFAAYLPAGATLDDSPDMSIEIAALPQSSYVVAYTMGGNAYLSLIEWNKDDAEYALASTLMLQEGDAMLDRVSKLTLMPMGAGDPMIVAQGTHDIVGDGGVTGTFAVARDSQGLGIVRRTDETGERGAAYFVVGATAKQSEELSFEDTDNDGRKEAVYVVRVTTDAGVARTLVHGYRFKDGEFFYDADLSKLLTVTKSLFPEPPKSE